MKKLNEVEIRMMALSENESYARACVAGFCSKLNPTIDEITDIKTAVSEAVTNSVVHAYPGVVGEICIKVVLYPSTIEISVMDFGIGIDDINKAREPFFSTANSIERSGMGFTVMESFMDKVDVMNNKTKGVTVKMTKTINKEAIKVAN